jgi:hypothetical protein
MEIVTLLEAAHLELQGAERRLALARQALADFDAETAERNVSVELAESFRRERDLLDAARRRHEESARLYRELREAQP